MGDRDHGYNTSRCFLSSHPGRHGVARRWAGLSRRSFSGDGWACHAGALAEAGAVGLGWGSSVAVGVVGSGWGSSVSVGVVGSG